MPFTIDFLDDGRVLEWNTTPSGATVTEQHDYTPRFYVASRTAGMDPDFRRLQAVYDQHPAVVKTDIVTQRPSFRRDHEDVLAVTVTHIDRITSLARQAYQVPDQPLGDLTCFNVDLSRGFRYCLETGTSPTPNTELSTLRLSVPVSKTASDTYTALSIGNDTVSGSPEAIISAVQAAVETQDPDVLICSTSEIIPALHEMATEAGLAEFSLSRWPDIDYQQLASRSTYASYGQVGHSPARYNVPGRAIIDKSNTFFYNET